MTPDDATLYVSQKAFIRDGDRVLILNDPRFGLDFPGGKLQPGEVDLAEALRREVREETGLEIDVGAPFIAWVDAGHPATVRTGLSVLLIGYNCRLRSGDLRLSEEHDAHRWITRADLVAVQDGSTYCAALNAWFARGADTG
jgi:8-oxo-dGTP pyrophosphatase MutT (NUDIX family)